VVAVLLTVASAGVPVAHAVELTFAVAASTFCPMLLLGIWWRGLTAPGAVAGLVVGGGLSMGAVVSTTFGIATDGWVGVVLTQPAAVSVPAAFATMASARPGAPRPQPGLVPSRASVGHDRSSREHDRSSRLTPRTASRRGHWAMTGPLSLPQPPAHLLPWLAPAVRPGARSDRGVGSPPHGRGASAAVVSR
jgi:hypothetical protein